MKFFYIDTPIRNSELRSSLKCNFHSEIIYKSQTLNDRLRDSLDSNFRFQYCNIEDVQSLKNEKGIFWCSDILFKSYDNQKLFLEKILYSISPFLWGNKDSYIFKGKFSDIEKFKNTENALNDSLERISDLKSFQSIIDEDFDTRYFNQIFKVEDEYIKKSEKVDKLKKEYEFLNSVPDQMKKYFISANNFALNKDGAQYAMPKIGYLDVSRRFLNGKISEAETQRFFDELKRYFDISKNISFKRTGDEFNFIYSKTLERINDFKKSKTFIELEEIFKFQNLGSLEDNFDKLLKILKNRKKSIIDDGSIFSHGDLCLSNILASENFDRIVLIDPRGGSFNESVRSIYYDFAKLSHSINGNYDKIINGFADMRFEESLNIKVNFKGDENISFSKGLKSLSENFGLDYELIKIVEASLFLSMLPLHSENKSKVAMLALNGCRILNNIN